MRFMYLHSFRTCMCDSMRVQMRKVVSPRALAAMLPSRVWAMVHVHGVVRVRAIRATAVSRATSVQQVHSLFCPHLRNAVLRSDYHNFPACTYCDPSSTCGGHGTCSSMGACVCKQGFAGQNCDYCADGYAGYPTCSVCHGPTCMRGFAAAIILLSFVSQAAASTASRVSSTATARPASAASRCSPLAKAGCFHVSVRF